MPEECQIQIVKGNIADYEGGAIVVPRFTSYVGGDIADALIKKICDTTHESIDQIRQHSVFRGNVQPVELYSAWHYKDTKLLPGVDDYITATCFLLPDQKGDPFYTRAHRTMINVLKVASEHNIAGLAVPILMTGEQKGSLDEVLPAMMHVCCKHGTTDAKPDKITIYTRSDEAHEKALHFHELIRTMYE